MSTSHAPPVSSARSPEEEPGRPTDKASEGQAVGQSPELVPLVPSSTRRTRVPRWLRRTSGPLLLLVLWQVLTSVGVLTPEVLASPGTIARVGADLVSDGSLPAAMGVSLQRVAIGLLCGVVVGTGLALLSGLFRVGEDLVDASVQMLRTVPFVGLIPLFIIWFGIGEAPKVAIITLGVSFPLYLNVYAGIRGVDSHLIEAGESLGLSRWGLVRHVVLPGALPGAMTGLRYSLGISWLALVFAEQINADSRHRIPDGAGAGLPAHRRHRRLPDRLRVPRPARRLRRPFPRKAAAAMATDVHRPVTPSPETTIGAGSAVRVEGLSRSFDGRAVIDDLQLDVQPGEFVALLGRSGCGKSTLLRILAGLDRDIEGTVLVPRRKAVAFQAPRLMPWKRVWRNVLLGLPGKPERGVAERALDEVGLGHRTDAWPKTLSGGEAQRASLAHALVREPDLLLLDEPFGALDALTRIKAQRLVGELWQRRGCAVLLVTHDVEEAVLLADRVLVMDDGVIAHETRVDLERPRDLTDPRFAELRAELLNRLGVDESSH